MKKESAILFIAIAFIVGVVVGVIAAVVYEDFSVPPSSIKPPASPVARVMNPDAQKQISVLQTLLKEDPKNQKALIELGNLYFDADQFDPAIQAYSKALEIDPKNADVRTDMGIMFRRKGDFDRASPSSRRLRRVIPTTPIAVITSALSFSTTRGTSKGRSKPGKNT